MKSKEKEYVQNYDRVHKQKKEVIVGIIYSSQKQSSKTRGQRSPEYTKNELMEWLYSQTLFHEIYDEWVQSGYRKRLKPSVDRKHDDVHYCMSNIQLMTWGENNEKSHKDLKSGKLFDKHTPIRQISKAGELINEFISQMEAHRETNISQGNIGMVCRGSRKTAGGFVWEYKGV